MKMNHWENSSFPKTTPFHTFIQPNFWYSKLLMKRKSTRWCPNLLWKIKLNILTFAKTINYVRALHRQFNLKKKKQPIFNLLKWSIYKNKVMAQDICLWVNLLPISWVLCSHIKPYKPNCFLHSYRWPNQIQKFLPILRNQRKAKFWN